MTTTVLTLSRMKKNMQKKIKSVELARVEWEKICFISLIAAGIFLLFYIYQINVLTKGTYLLNSYEKNINQISQANKKLEINFAENSFLGEVISKAQELNLQKTTSVKYIQVLDASLANAK